MGQGQRGGQYGAKGGVCSGERGRGGSGIASGLGPRSGPGPGLELGREHTQELLSVSVTHAQWHQKRPLLLAVHMPGARKRCLGTPRRS